MKQIVPPTGDDRPLWDVWLSAFHFPALAAADEVGLFPLLEKGPASAPELAAGLLLSLGSAEALLGVLASLGFVQQQATTFSLTGVSRVYLLPGSPYYWGGLLRYFRRITANYETMRQQLRGREAAAPAPDGGQKGAPEDGPGQSPEDTSGDLDEAAAFTQAMHSLSFPAAAVVALRGDFQAARRFLDVGGGSGSYCIALALQHPDIRCTVLDVPEVCPVAAGFIRQYGVEDRVDTIPLDMFAAPWPPGYDVHFLSNIFHGLEVSRCLQLARSSHEALDRGGRICVHEVLLNDTKDGPPAAASFSLAMRYFNGMGGQFTAAEIEDILREAGFADLSVTPTYGYYSLVTGVKP